jgi:hypothetical protein
MITLQIVEHADANLHKELLRAMRSGDLRTFSAQNRGKKITHVTYKGWMNWTRDGNVISCSVKYPRNPKLEWQFMHAFLGRLADRYPQYIQSITIQFPSAEWED